MEHFFRHVLKQIGIHSTIHRIDPVTGGTMSDAYKLETDRQTYFVKTKENVHHDFFQKEMLNLVLLRKTQTIALPEPYGEWYDPQTKQGVLIMEWVEGVKTETTEQKLGQQLAHLHLSFGSNFGLHEDNYIGTLPQLNGWSNDWISFYRDRRIDIQVAIGKKRGVIQGKRLRKLEKLMDRLDTWLDHHPKPSPLHGDLWYGNWIPGPNGNPYLVDPATFYGDHELEIAFTECFGGFSQVFYDAYQEVFPVSSTYPDRKPLYMLLFLLIHLNLFGERYGPRVDEILHYYVAP